MSLFALYFLLQAARGSVRVPDRHVIQQRLQIGAEARDIFSAKKLLLALFLFRESVGLLFPRELVDPVDFFLLHDSFLSGVIVMIQGKWFPQGSGLSDVLSVREAVLNRGEDPLDALAQNVVVYQDGVPAATGRIRWEDGSFWLDGVAVLPDYRGRRLGDLTLRLLLFKAQSHFAREVRLICPPEVTGFFTRLGFRRDEGAENPQELRIPGDEIDLDTCKACRKADCPRRAE